MSREFTQKERDLHQLMWEADALVTELKRATKNTQGCEDTIHPLESTVKHLASRIDQMLDRMQR